MAAVGDGFFWAGLRPFFGALAAVGILAVGWSALVVVVLAYNALQLGLRWKLFRAGYRSGDEVVATVAALSLPAWAARLRAAGTVTAGVAVGLLALGARPALGGATGAVSLAAALAAWGALALGARLLPTAYLALALGTGAGALLRLRGGP